MCVGACIRERESEEIKKCYHVCTCVGIFACKECMSTVCVWRCAVCCGCGKQWSIFSHYPTAYVWFIYIHGYPDNEAFNPGDPVVRTMNPITSCRLWDGMADSETDGRGCTRPAIQSHSSRLLPVSPVHVFCSNLSTGRGQRTWDHYITHTNNSANTHTWTSTLPEVHSTPAISLLRSPPLTCTSGFSLPSNTTLILRAHILHLREEEREVRKGFCGQGNI